MAFWELFRDKDHLWVQQVLEGQWAGWTVVTRFVPDQRGVPVIAELRIFPGQGIRDTPNVHWMRLFNPRGIKERRPPVGGLPATLVRRGIPLGKHVQFVNKRINRIVGMSAEEFRQLSRINQLVVGAIQKMGFKVEESAPAPKPAGIRRGRPLRWSVADYAKIALLYDDAVTSGRSPIAWIAEHVGSEAIARNLVAGARRAGKLPKAAGSGRRESAPLTRDNRRLLQAEARASTITRRA